MPYLWIDYQPSIHVSRHVYTTFEDCVKSIRQRILDDPDLYIDVDSGPRPYEEACQRLGNIVYVFYDCCKKKIEIHFVDVV